MKKLGVLLLMATFILTGMSTVLAQGDDHDDFHYIKVTIPEVVYLDIESDNTSTDIQLNPTHSTEAGDPLNFNNLTDNSLWLNYSSIASSSGATRKITVEMSAAVPSGMTLGLSPSAPAATGGGDRGTSQASLSPDNTIQDVVTGIGSCYTGNGTLNGVNLTYALNLDPGNYEDLVAGAITDLTVTYTLTDE